MKRRAVFGLFGLTVLFSLLAIEGASTAKGLTEDLVEYLRESDDIKAKVLQEKLSYFSIIELDQTLAYLKPMGEPQKGLQPLLDNLETTPMYFLHGSKYQG